MRDPNSETLGRGFTIKHQGEAKEEWRVPGKQSTHRSLPKGTRDVKITYDNSADNPRNPTSPPKRVRWGEGSNDEMGSMSLLAVAANEAEIPQLQQTYRQHVRSALTKGGGVSLLLCSWRSTRCWQGEKIAEPVTKAVGCALPPCLAPGQTPGSQAQP